MIYYAIGGGLGHLTRAQAVIHTLNINPKNIHILTALPNAQQLCPNHSIIQVPSTLAQQPKKYQQWLQNLITTHNIQQIYLDTFPFGILGEWLPFLSNPDLQFHYIARHLQFNKYRQGMPCLLSTPLSFKPSFPQSFNPSIRTLLTEPLTPSHQQWINQNSQSIQALHLQYPPIPTPTLPFSINWQNTWLIVHSQPQEEILALLQYAQQKAKRQQQSPDILVICNTPLPALPSSIKTAHIYPTYPLFKKSAQIFIAGGFNSIHQTQAFAHKRHIIPFPRRYDDQFWRTKHFTVKT